MYSLFYKKLYCNISHITLTNNCRKASFCFNIHGPLLFCSTASLLLLFFLGTGRSKYSLSCLVVQWNRYYDYNIVSVEHLLKLIKRKKSTYVIIRGKICYSCTATFHYQKMIFFVLLHRLSSHTLRERAFFQIRDQ